MILVIGGNMKKFIEENKKVFEIMISVTLCICAVIAFYSIAQNPQGFFEWLGTAISSIGKLVNPILVGLLIAYLLYRPCRALTRQLMKLKYYKNKEEKANTLSVLLVFILTLAFLVAFMFMIIPNTVESITTLVGRLAELEKPAKDLVDRLYENEIVKDVLRVFNIDAASGEENGSEVLVGLLSKGKTLFTAVGGFAYIFVSNLGSFLYNFFIGFIIAIYVNLDYKHLMRQFKKIIMCITGKHYERLKYIAELSDKTFYNYFEAKVVTSFVIGFMGYVLCLIFRIQYAATIGIIVAVTNLIPIFGPWVGGIFCVLFTLLSGLKKAIIVAVMIVLLQQFDSNYIGPRILGPKIDLNGFWVFVSVIVMGSIGGVLGMLISMPLFSVLQVLIGEAVEKKLAASGRTEEI